MAEAVLNLSKADIAESPLSSLTSFNLHEIRKHNKKEDLWIIMAERVYDITNIVSKHPGGEDVIWEQIKINQNLTEIFYKMMHSENALSLLQGHCIGRVDKTIINWGDLFGLKIEILDNQHKNIIDIMNEIYCNGNINDLNKFITAWSIHSETEEYFMDTFNFATGMKADHINEHKRITALLQDFYDDLVKKYDDKLNPKKTEKCKDDHEGKERDDKKNMYTDENEPFKCQELMDFCKDKMVLMFKKHAFEHDSLYIDKILGEDDPSKEIKTEKHGEFDLIKPIFPHNQ